MSHVGLCLVVIVYISHTTSAYGSLPLSVCNYGLIDLVSQIKLMKDWTRTAVTNGRTDDWWLASYLAVSNFNIDATKAHIERYYNFKKNYPNIIQARKWFLSYLLNEDADLSEEATKSNQRVLELMDNGFILGLVNVPPDGDGITILRFSAVPDKMPYKDVTILLSMFWDIYFSFIAPKLVQSALDWSKLVCEGQTVPPSSTTNKCKDCSGDGITTPNQSNITFPLALSINTTSQKASALFQFDLRAYRAGVTGILDTNGIPSHRMHEFASVVPSVLFDCLSIYPFHLNQIHIFNDNKRALEKAFEDVSQQSGNIHLEYTQTKMNKLYLHGGDYSILEKCGLPLNDLPTDYGGSTGSVEELAAIWEKLLEDGGDAYIEENQFI